MLNKNSKWEDFPYWLKGGIIGVVISLFPSLMISFYNCSFVEYFSFSDYPGEGSFCIRLYNIETQFWLLSLIIMTIAIPIFLALVLVGGVIGQNIFFYPVRIAFTIIHLGIFFFLAGSLFGWIYGKLKNKRKKELNNI
jgi:hypothetical protein